LQARGLFVFQAKPRFRKPAFALGSLEQSELPDVMVVAEFGGEGAEVKNSNGKHGNPI
jgi:hypothetical protein